MYYLSLWFMAILYILAGVMHFVKPAVYMRIMPPYLPAPLALVFASGAAEILLGICLFVPKLRVPAAWGVIALLIAVFPANWNMYSQGSAVYGIADWILLLRLPLQLVLIAWAFVYTRP